jgi:hypothetical protein
MSEKRAIKLERNGRDGADVLTDPRDPECELPQATAILPMSVGLVGSVALREQRAVRVACLDFVGTMIFGGLRAEVGFGPRSHVRRAGCVGAGPSRAGCAVATTVSLLQREELYEVHMGRVLPNLEGDFYAWIQIGEAGGIPITDHLHVGRLTGRPRPFSFRFSPLVRVAASVVSTPRSKAAGTGMEVAGEVEFVRGISATVRLAAHTAEDAPPVIRVASLEIVPGAGGIRFSTKLPWIGNRDFGATSVQFLDGAGRPLNGERVDPAARRIIGNERLTPSTLSIH